MNDPIRTNGLRTYFKDLRRQRRIDVDHERELLHRVADGDERAMQELVSANLGFVVKVAREYQNLGIELEDLINEGNVGLIEAAGRFDPGRDNKFISYAVWWIRRKIMSAINRHATTVRLPVSYRRRMRVERERERAERINGPTEPVVQRRVPRPVEYAARLSSLPTTQRVGLDDRVEGGQSASLAEMIVDGTEAVDATLERNEAVSLLRHALQDLSPRELHILRRRYGLDGESPWTLQEIGDELGCTREWVRQIELRTRRKLAQLLEAAFAIGADADAAVAAAG